MPIYDIQKETDKKKLVDFKQEIPIQNRNKNYYNNFLKEKPFQNAMKQI